MTLMIRVKSKDYHLSQMTEGFESRIYNLDHAPLIRVK